MSSEIEMQKTAGVRLLIESRRATLRRTLDTSKSRFFLGRVTALLAFSVLLSACSVCHVQEGDYRNFGGGEKDINLSLKSDNTFTLSGTSWRPAQYESRSTELLQGTWSCHKKQVTLERGKTRLNGILTEIGENPLGLAENVEAIVFLSTNTEKAQGLDGEILYPTEVLEE